MNERTRREIEENERKSLEKKDRERMLERGSKDRKRNFLEGDHVVILIYPLYVYYDYD